jgi:hypothetical protein
MALASSRYHVLYWIKGHVPNPAQIADARQYGPHCAFRNANFHTVGSGLEPCSAVAGDVPADYRNRFPKAVPYMEWLDGKLETRVPSAAAAPVSTGPTDGELEIPMMRDRGAPALPPPPPPPPGAEGLDAEAAAGQDAPSDFGLTPPPPQEGSAPMAPPPPPKPTDGRRLSQRQRAALERGEQIYGETEA